MQGIEQWKKVDKLEGFPDRSQTTILTHDLARDAYYLEVRQLSQGAVGPLPVTPEAAARCVDCYGFKLVNDTQPARKRPEKARHVS